MADTIQHVQIVDETRRRYWLYAQSVITARALPDVRDGLKPVQRRILYTMWHELGLSFDAKARKSAQIVGDVMGKYHPHGDTAIYDALVRMAQDWVMRHPLVHGQGNFGSVDGDPPAAYRYTEAKLSALADTLLAELRQRTVETRPTYDNSRHEPVVLPAQYPNLLVNGTSGIAVGLATNIPPHNLGEVLRACVALIDAPETTPAELMQRVKGPDFPLGGKIVTDRATLKKIYEDGRGSIKVQAEWAVEDLGRGRQQVVITSVPYGVEKGKLEEEMGRIIEDRKLPQVLSLTNEMNKKAGVRLTMELKAGSDANVVMAYFFKHTALQENFAYNMTCLVPGPDGVLRPETLGLKPMLRHFLDFRLTTVRKRFEYELDVLRRRLHLLDGFRIVFDALDEALVLIRNSQGKADAAQKLIARFGLDQDQATAVLDAQIYKIAQMEIRDILDELRDKTRQSAELAELLESESRLWGVVKAELGAIEAKYGGKRRSRMATDEDVLEFDEEAYIQRENTNLVLTRDGWVKRVGRLSSVESTRVREGDEVVAVVPGTTLDHAIFFAEDGTAYTARMNEIPVSSGHGVPISKHFKLADQVRIIGVATTDERFVPAETPPARDGDPAGPYVLAVTSAGMVVRTPLGPFRTASTKNGRRFVKLGDDDKVVLVRIVTNEPGLILAATSGHVVHFALDQVSVLSGVGKGVIGIKLDDSERCLGGRVVTSDKDVLALETSQAKTLEVKAKSQPQVQRGGKGAEVVKRGRLIRVIPPAVELPDWDKIDAGEAKEAKAKPKPDAPAGPTLFQ